MARFTSLVRARDSVPMSQVPVNVIRRITSKNSDYDSDSSVGPQFLACIFYLEK